jgi:hypothetical protein
MIKAGDIRTLIIIGLAVTVLVLSIVDLETGSKHHNNVTNPKSHTHHP